MNSALLSLMTQEYTLSLSIYKYILQFTPFPHSGVCCCNGFVMHENCRLSMHAAQLVTFKSTVSVKPMSSQQH